MISLARLGGDLPPDHESVSLDADGTVRVERSVAGSRIGLFSRHLDPAELAAITAAAAAAGAEGPRGLRSRPHDAIETIEVDGVTGRFDPYGTSEGPWGELAGILRALLEDRTVEPVAGFGLTIGADGRTAVLERLGVGGAEVTAGSVSVEARIVRDGMVARSWIVPAPEVPVSVPAGWSVTFDLAPPEAMGTGYLEAQIDLDAGFDGPAIPRRVIAAL